MTKAVKWGILSTADINKKLLAGAAASDDVEVIAVGSRDHGRAEEFARTWGIDRAYGTYDELLADPDVAAVYIPLPNTMHSEWSIRALEAGKHVLCEKPFSRHIADVERAFDAAAATGLHLSEAFMYRHHPQTARLAELVASGAIGELRVIRSAFSYSLYDAENIRLRTDVEGGALMDVGCYCVSGSRLLAGEPESVVGAGHIGSSGTDWVFTGLMRFPGDVVALFDCGTSLPNRDELEAIGTKGSLFLDDPWHCQSPVIEVRRDGSVERIEIEGANPYQLELEDMNAAIRGERPPLLGRADALGQVHTIEGLYRSAAENRTVAL
jgi:xylose dehydrogenase (NAD/NADP)